MSNELSQLDQLIESDILEALGKNPKALEIDANEDENLPLSNDYDGILIEDFIEESNTQEEPTQFIEEENTSTEVLKEELNPADSIDTTQKFPQEVSTANLAQLLSELLNNKTIEITIKIKD